MHYSAKVIPRAKVNKIVEESKGHLKVHLTAPAKEGRANEALVKALAKHFGVKKRQVKIVRGEKSRQKVIEIV
ncbi:MAG: DUF167 domain-containing protein [bacterium]